MSTAVCNPVIIESQNYAWSKHIECIHELDQAYRQWIRQAMEQKLVVHKKLQTKMYKALTEMKDTDQMKWNMLMNKHLQVIHDLEYGYASDITKLLQNKLHIHMNMMKKWYQFVFQQLINKYEEKKKHINLQQRSSIRTSSVGRSHGDAKDIGVKNRMIPINTMNVPMLEKESADHNQKIDNVSTNESTFKVVANTDHHTHNRNNNSHHHNKHTQNSNHQNHHQQQQRINTNILNNVNTENNSNNNQGSINVIINDDIVYLYTNNNDTGSVVAIIKKEEFQQQNQTQPNGKDDEEMTTPSMGIESETENKSDEILYALNSGKNNCQNTDIICQDRNSKCSTNRTESKSLSPDFKKCNVLGCGNWNHNCNIHRNRNRKENNEDQIMSDKNKNHNNHNDNTSNKQNSYNDQEQLTLNCPLCKGSTFANQSTLLSHLKNIHNILFQ